jgi:TolB-like protein
LGSVHVFKGTPEASLVHFGTAIRLSPNDTNLGSFFVRKAQAHLYMQEHEEAVKWARRALGLPNFQWSRYVMLISALGHLGRTGEATKAIEALMQRVPNFSRQYALDFSPWLDDDYFEHLMDGLRKAGLPDAAPAGNAAPPLPDKPSIAVLPFDNLSGDPEQEYFSDGITEDIITALSRIRQFFVIARNTTFTFKGRAVDVQAVASDLGVRYVLEGSVRKSGNRVRITAQLIDGDTGNHIWAEKYDRELEDIFAV